MAKHTFKKGLNLPISGAPEARIEAAAVPLTVGLVADDYVGMRPRMLVQVGDRVKRGQHLFEDRKTPGVFYSAPGSGLVAAINRGARRALQTVVIELDAAERDGRGEQVSFESAGDEAGATDAGVRALLVESGLWTALRKRPYGKVPSPDGKPAALFVTAMESHPLAPSVEDVLAGLPAGAANFQRGVEVLSRLTDGPTFVCKGAGSQVTATGEKVQVEEFAGPHPAGTPGLHIHTLLPASRSREVWYVGYQDVVAIGMLFATGTFMVERTVSLAGPGVKSPRLLQTRLGAALGELTRDQLAAGDNRVVSGSVFSGRTFTGEADGYLGRYHNQVTVLPEGHVRHFLGWAMPGAGVFSILPAFLSRFIGRSSFDFNTDKRGGERAMVPIGMYEKVMPMDILPTFLLRAIAAGDVERAEELGVLELDEEDVALCTFVCPSKIDYGMLLREMLTTIEKES